MTEDMMWEQQSILSKLGTSQEAAKVRAKMQTTSLLSDMQAFKVGGVSCGGVCACVCGMCVVSVCVCGYLLLGGILRWHFYLVPVCITLPFF